MLLNLGFSPCPNDTFIFNALVNGGIAAGELTFEPFLADVEALNSRAIAREAFITKLSFGAIPLVSEHYQILDSGAALGFGCGPLLICKPDFDVSKLAEARVLIPGFHTTANLLLSMAYPEIKHKEERLFSEIESALLNGEADAGLIIHESRFTYSKKGLKKIADLGAWWEERYQLPVPLGCIAIRRDAGEDLKQQVQQLIRQSVEEAFARPELTQAYVAAHAQEMEPEVMQAHIDLYVNDFSVSLGEPGRQAIREMFGIAARAGLVPQVKEPLFV